MTTREGLLRLDAAQREEAMALRAESAKVVEDCRKQRAQARMLVADARQAAREGTRRFRRPHES